VAGALEDPSSLLEAENSILPGLTKCYATRDAAFMTSSKRERRPILEPNLKRSKAFLPLRLNGFP